MNKNGDKQYKNSNIAYISRIKRYVDEDGNKGTETEVYKKYMVENTFGDFG